MYYNFNNMTDEEKKTIDKLKNEKKYRLVEIIRVFKKEGIENFIITRKEYLDIILNLIEKQSNEIEELKEDRDKFKKALGKRITYCNELEKDLFENCSNYVVSKDKIKSKIEELDIEIQCCEYADDDLEEYKQDVEKEKARLLRDKAILQSLLEEGVDI